jgi:hypothetical protein
MHLLQRGSKKCDEKGLKIMAITYGITKIKRVESTQNVDLLGTSCGPQVEKHCITLLLRSTDFQFVFIYFFSGQVFWIYFVYSLFNLWQMFFPKFSSRKYGTEQNYVNRKITLLDDAPPLQIIIAYQK